MRTIAALLATFPLLALAQGAPPPADPAAAPAQPPAAEPATAAPAPPAYPPAPQAAAPALPPGSYAQPGYAPPGAAPYPARMRPPKARDSWYIGFGLGGGDGKVANETSTASFKEINGDRSPTTAFFNFKVGATMTPRLLLGLDIGVVSSAADEGGIQTALGIANIDAVATYFPMERGFFVKGGVGRSSVTYTVDISGVGSADGSATGWNVVGGVGYAWWLGQQFNLTANLEFSRQWYGSSTDLNIDDSQFWALWVGCDWY